MSSLLAKVALVAGGTRGAGRGIAVELGAAGAMVYVTGRSTRGRPSEYSRPETIEETAALVTGAGGTGIPSELTILCPPKSKRWSRGSGRKAADSISWSTTSGVVRSYSNGTRPFGSTTSRMA